MRAPRGIRGLMAVAACVGLPLLLAGMAGTAGASPPSEPRVLSSGLVFSEPDADGHFAAWGAVDAGGGRGIYLWNLDTDEETSIAEESGTPHVAGGLVVWERRLGDEVEIVCYQIATGRSAVISRGEGWHHLLCAQGGQIGRAHV